MLLFATVLLLHLDHTSSDYAMSLRGPLKSHLTAFFKVKQQPQVISDSVITPIVHGALVHACIKTKMHSNIFGISSINKSFCGVDEL